MAAGWWWIVRLVKSPVLWPDDKPGMKPTNVESLVTWLIVGIILGGRLGFVVFYNPAHYLRYPEDILRVWEGGMSFHGGLLGVLVSGMLFCRWHRIDPACVADCIACSVPIGIGLGRTANFVNAELWGKPTDLPWAVEFPGAGGACPSWWIEVVCGRHPSQIYEAALEGAVLFALLNYLAFRRGWLKIPGQLTGAFLAAYGCFRTFVEYFREADQRFTSDGNPHGFILQTGSGLESIGLTMGQLLSLPMIIAGIAILMLSRRRVRLVDS